MPMGLGINWLKIDQYAYAHIIIAMPMNYFLCVFENFLHFAGYGGCQAIT